VIDDQTLATTRRTLHGIAEHILAAHQWRVAGTIRLGLWENGFCTGTLDAVPAVVGVRGVELVALPDGPAVPIAGSLGELAERVGVGFGLSGAPYPPESGCGPDDEAVVDAAAVAELVAAWWAGQRALTELTGGDEASAPVLWPEHFDLGVTLDEVNYGLSPGDAHLPRPYAYVGPWQPRTGAFWTAPFGAARPVAELDGAAGVLEFFREGRARAAVDPR
jgi:hypothetical protein